MHNLEVNEITNYLYIEKNLFLLHSSIVFIFWF